MEMETREGKLSISDTELVFEPNDNSETVTVSLNPAPDYSYTRGVYGVGTLDIDGHAIVLDKDQATHVVEELRRPRTAATKTSRTRNRNVSDADDAVSTDSTES